MKSVIYLFFTLFLFFNRLESMDEYHYVDLKNSVVNSYVNQIKKTKKLHLKASGGSMTTNINVIFLKFESDQVLDLPGVRKLFVETVEGLLYTINQNTKIRPYLHDFPFTKNNTEISISFSNAVDSGLNKKIEYVVIINGDVIYTTSKEKNGTLITFLKEPYEESLRKVKEISDAND